MALLNDVTLTDKTCRNDKTAGVKLKENSQKGEMKRQKREKRRRIYWGSWKKREL